MGISSSVYVKCSCGNTFEIDNPEIKKIFVVTRSKIDEVQYTFDYKCPKCGKETHATGYFS